MITALGTWGWGSACPGLQEGCGSHQGFLKEEELCKVPGALLLGCGLF